MGEVRLAEIDEKHLACLGKTGTWTKAKAEDYDNLAKLRFADLLGYLHDGEIVVCAKITDAGRAWLRENG